MDTSFPELQAELQLNFQKRRGHGLLSVLQPKFSGVLGEALDVAARWSGDVVSTFSLYLIMYFKLLLVECCCQAILY